MSSAPTTSRTTSRTSWRATRFRVKCCSRRFFRVHRPARSRSTSSAQRAERPVMTDISEKTVTHPAPHRTHAVLNQSVPRTDVNEFLLDTVLAERSEEHTSELQSLMRNSYAV